MPAAVGLGDSTVCRSDESASPEPIPAAGATGACLSASAREIEDIPTRASLLSQLRNISSDDSWLVFYETYRALMFNTARRHGLSATESDEVIQQTMIRLARSLPNFKYDFRRGSFKAWLKTQVRWNVLDLLKQRKSVVPLTDKLADEYGVETFEKEWDAEWNRFVFDRAFRSIKQSASPHCVQIFLNAVVQGKGIAETARTLRISKMAVHLAVFKVRRSLREQIARFEQSGDL